MIARETKRQKLVQKYAAKRLIGSRDMQFRNRCIIKTIKQIKVEATHKYR